jgi:biotin transport system substrate-specific component
MYYGDWVDRIFITYTTGVVSMQTKHIILALVVPIAMAASAQVVLPNNPAVPGTLQCLAIMLLGSFMGLRAGLNGAVIYAVGGALGIPWFSGMDADMTTTGGYIIGFIPAIALVGLQSDKGNLSSFVSSIGTYLVALMIIYVFGVSWMLLGAGYSFKDAYSLGVQVTFVGDIVEITLASAIVTAYGVVRQQATK